MPSTKRCIDRQTCLSGWVLCIVNVDRNMNINLSGWYIYSHGLRHWATARFVFPRLMQWKRRLGPRVVVCHVKYLYSVISQWKINLAKERENQFGKCTIEWQALPSVEGGRGRSFSAPAFFRFGFIQYSAGKCQNIRQSNVVPHTQFRLLDSLEDFSASLLWNISFRALVAPLHSFAVRRLER